MTLRCASSKIISDIVILQADKSRDIFEDFKFCFFNIRCFMQWPIKRCFLKYVLHSRHLLWFREDKNPYNKELRHCWFIHTLKRHLNKPPFNWISQHIYRQKFEWIWVWVLIVDYYMYISSQNFNKKQKQFTIFKLIYFVN